jgi:hypothetical protein
MSDLFLISSKGSSPTVLSNVMESGCQSVIYGQLPLHEYHAADSFPDVPLVPWIDLIATENTLVVVRQVKNPSQTVTSSTYSTVVATYVPDIQQ